MTVDLNLSGWIERRRSDVGPYADHIINGVAEYEAEIVRLRASLADISDQCGEVLNGGSWPSCDEEWAAMVEKVERTADSGAEKEAGI